MVAMKIVANIASLVPLLAVAAFVLALGPLWADGQGERRTSRGDGVPEIVVDGQGNLHVPANYRATYEFLGTWAIAANKGVGSGELHAVYASPGTIAAYRTSGGFPGGTVVVKKVYESATAPRTKGT